MEISTFLNTKGQRSHDVVARQSGPSRPRLLLLVDDRADAKRSLAQLAGAGFEVDSEIVCFSKEFTERLREQHFDLILAAYRLPDWNGLEALRWLRNSGYDTPFILVSGELGDDVAVECIKEGATDYVLKDRLDRLPRVCRRAIEECRLREERDRAEQQLRDSEEQYRILFDSNPLPMWVFDRETLAFLAVNEAAVSHYGFSQHEFLAMTILDIRPKENIPAILQAVSKPYEGFSRVPLSKHLKKDGTLIDVEITSHSVIFRGRPAELILAHDITQQKRNQERLRQSDEIFAKVFRASPLAITISTVAEGRYLDVNDAFSQIMGYTREQIVGRTTQELNIWLDPGDRFAIIRELEAIGRVAAFQSKFRTQAGNIRLVEVSAELIELDGETCLLAITRDVTEAKGLEEQFLQAQKMEAVGRLAGGVAHDFNNMLGVIIGYSELLQGRLEPGPQRKGVDEIKKAAERASGLTRQLLAFSRQQVIFPRVLNLNTVVDNLSNMLLPMIGEDIDLVITPGTSLGSVRAHLSQVEQIIMNLVVNARDAMPQGGKLIVSTSNAELDEAYASHHPPARPGSYVLVSVSDTGTGISPEILPHIFEPFFTTKQPGKGTGLGLSVVDGVVNQSGGYVSVYTEPGRGTTFKVYLPRVDEEATAEHDQAQCPPHRGSGTILLVEDEEPLRTLMAGLLEDNGYRVLQASDGDEAIRQAKLQSSVDLLLTDVVLPRLNGRELGIALQGFLPNLKVLYVSGYANELITQHGVLANEGAFLEKPFTKNSLLNKVSAILERR